MAKILSFQGRKKYFEPDNFCEAYTVLDREKRLRVAVMLLGFYSRQITEQETQVGELETVYKMLQGEYLDMFLDMVNDQVVDG